MPADALAPRRLRGRSRGEGRREADGRPAGSTESQHAVRVGHPPPGREIQNMRTDEAELKRFRNEVNCAALLEGSGPMWRLDRRESTRRALKISARRRRGADRQPRRSWLVGSAEHRQGRRLRSGPVPRSQAQCRAGAPAPGAAPVPRDRAALPGSPWQGRGTARRRRAGRDPMGEASAPAPGLFCLDLTDGHAMPAGRENVPKPGRVNLPPCSAS